MANDQSKQGGKAQREQRQAVALRENLKRRKQQARGLAQEPAPGQTGAELAENSADPARKTRP
jgi:hypothetical protein